MPVYTVKNFDLELENPAKIFLGSISRYIQTPISRKITYLFSIFVWLYKGLKVNPE